MDTTGPHHAVLAVQATNTGRSPVTVKTWRIHYGDAAVGPGSPGHPDDSALPIVLGPNEQATWFCRLDRFHASTATASEFGRPTSPIRASASPGRGKPVSSAPLRMRWDDLPAYFGRELP